MNPIDKCTCITQEDLDTINEDAQQFGPDCIEGTPDDDDNNVGDDDCPEGYSYSFTLCMCVNNSPICSTPVCEAGDQIDPIEGCTCLSLVDFINLFNHGLGEDCIAGTEDDPVNPEPCQEFPWGWAYEQEYC